MGRTVAAARLVVDEELVELNRFMKALRENDRIAFEKLLVYPKLHISAITYAPRLNVFESMLLAMLLEQQKQIDELKVKTDDN